jgi:hypothetical protein
MSGSSMLVVTSVRVIQPYVLNVTFADGRERLVDVETALDGPIFEPLRDPSRFAEATVDSVVGTVVWPNGADLSPEFLSEAPELSAQPRPSRMLRERPGS